ALRRHGTGARRRLEAVAGPRPGRAPPRAAGPQLRGRPPGPAGPCPLRCGASSPPRGCSASRSRRPCGRVVDERRPTTPAGPDQPTTTDQETAV
ncbi:MAG: hypothetical protein AVDCRST_MAG48-508, partial [uncultured Friedmanniella sp.]